MSEIKGQLLGLLLVIGIFAAISGVLYTSFKNAAGSVASEVTVKPAFAADDTVEVTDYGFMAEIA